MPSNRHYGTLNKALVLNNGLNTAITANQSKMKNKKEERQPLLMASQTDPVNDVYDRTPIPRPDIRSSPDNVVVHLPGALEDGGSEGKSCNDGDDDGYNPILNRTLEHPTSNLDTMIHLLKGNIGTGILAMPDAFRNAGLIMGFFGTLLMGAICTHCMHMLVKCAHKLCRKRKVSALGFPDVVETAFEMGPQCFQPLAQTAKSLVNIFLCITQLGFCCVYFVFVAANLQEFFKYYDVNLDRTTYLVILLIPMILLNLVKNLKFLMPVSLMASILTVSGLGITFFYMLHDLPKTSTVHAFSSWSQLPLYFGTAIYAFEGIGVVLPLENNMKTPQDFGGWTGVLNTGMVIVASLYTAMGFFGYLKYGDAVSVGSITLNLPQDEILAQSVKLTMALAIFLSYGLQLYVPVGIIWPPIKYRLQSEQPQQIGEYALRVGLVIFTFGLAIMIPNLGAVISLVGAASSSTLAIIFPPIIEIITFWDSDLVKYHELAFAVKSRRAVLKSQTLFNEFKEKEHKPIKDIVNTHQVGFSKLFRSFSDIDVAISPGAFFDAEAFRLHHESPRVLLGGKSFVNHSMSPSSVTK